MITERQAGIWIGKLIVLIFCALLGYIAACTVSQAVNPKEWSEFARAIMLFVTAGVYVSHEK